MSASAGAGPPSDESLVTAAMGGDRAAFGSLVGRYERATRTVCMAVLRDQHLASDAAQDSFVMAYRSLGKLRDSHAFGAWLMRIARNRAMRMARNRKRESGLPMTVAQSGGGPKNLELLEAVAGLPEQERVVVMLRYFQGHEVGEIAGILGRPVGTITKQLSRARDRLRKALAMEDAS